MKLLCILAAVLPLAIAAPTDDAASYGINCRGSGMCIGCKQPLGDGGMLDFIQQLDDNAQFGNHQYAACKSCHILKSEGLCVFPQKTGTKLVTGRMIKDAVQQMKDHGCKYCGSAPIFDGTAEITVNYVTDGCIKHGDKIC